jgi:hypothetical protein
MRLSKEQSYMLLERHGSCIKELCDTCGKESMGINIVLDCPWRI